MTHQKITIKLVINIDFHKHFFKGSLVAMEKTPLSRSSLLFINFAFHFSFFIFHSISPFIRQRVRWSTQLISRKNTHTLTQTLMFLFYLVLLLAYRILLLYSLTFFAFFLLIFLPSSLFCCLPYQSVLVIGSNAYTFKYTPTTYIYTWLNLILPLLFIENGGNDK